MAKDDGYQGALDSIFGFIFSNNKADSKPLKPPKSTGVSGPDGLAAGLAELAMSPATLVSDEVFGRLNDFVDADMLRIALDKKGKDAPVGSEIRVRTKDLGKILADPNKYFDKQIKSAMKTTDATVKDLITGGAYLDRAIGYAVARGKFKLDHKMAGRVAMYAGKADYMNTIGGMRSDGAKLVAQNAILEQMKGNSSEDVLKAIAMIEKSSILKFGEDDLKAVLNKAGLGGHASAILGKFVPEPDSKEAKGGYRMGHMEYGNVLRRNLDGREKISSGEARKELRKAHALVESWTRLRSDLTAKDYKEFGGALDSMDEEITKLRASGGDADDQRILKGLMSERKKLKKITGEIEDHKNKTPFWNLTTVDRRRGSNKVRAALRSELAGRRHILAKQIKDARGNTGLLADLEERMGILRKQEKSLMSTQVSEFALRAGEIRKYSKYAGAFLSGDLNKLVASGMIFVSDKDEDLNPGGPGKFDGGFLHTRNRKGESHEDSKYSFVSAREDINPQLASLAGLYYVTPGSLVKTFLYNGELFAYNALSRKKKLVKAMNKDLGLMEQLSRDPRFSDFMKEGEFNYKNLDPKFLDFMDLLESDSAISQRYGLKKFKKLYERNGTLARAFSLPARTNQKLKDAFKKRFIDKYQKALMDRVTKRLGRMFGTDKLWQAAVKSFGAGNLGLRQLVQTGMTAAFSAVTGPLGPILAWIATELVMRLLPKVMSGIMKGLVLLIWGVIFGAIGIGIIFTMILGGASGKTNAWDYQLPEQAVLLATTNPYGPEFLIPPEDDIPDIPDAPPGSTCPLLGSIDCNQGPYGYLAEEFASHRRMPTGAIDTGGPTTWHAPANGTVTSYSPSNTCMDGKDYGGVLIFTDEHGNSYRMLHVQGLITGGKVAKGKAVAIMRFDLEYSDCWMGAHFHLDTKVGGTWTDSEVWYRDKLNCSLAACPPTYYE